MYFTFLGRGVKSEVWVIAFIVIFEVGSRVLLQWTRKSFFIWLFCMLHLCTSGLRAKWEQSMLGVVGSLSAPFPRLGSDCFYSRTPWSYSVVVEVQSSCLCIAFLLLWWLFSVCTLCLCIQSHFLIWMKRNKHETCVVSDCLSRASVCGISVCVVGLMLSTQVLM